MDDDLDSLLKDLSTASKPVKPQATVTASVNMNELDSLISNLSEPAPKEQRTGSKIQKDELDDLMSSLSIDSSKGQNDNKQKSKAHPSATNMAKVDDLDDLLGDLSAPAQKPATKSRPAVAQVDLSASLNAPKQTENESLDDLLTQLSTGPKSKQTNNAPEGDSLDDLLSQLSTDAIKNNKTNQSGKENDNLDNLLQNLNSSSTDMSGLGSRHGVCAKCGKQITGQIVSALGKSFHPEHFTCGTCQKLIGSQTFYDVNGIAQCEQCFKSLSCPRCGYCDQPIIDKYVTALGKKWHPEHFICTQCLQPFVNGAFFERDGKPYCENDFYALYAFRCASCNETIKGECVTAFGVKWHPEHFNCQYCHEQFIDGAFFEYQGKPYCEQHYHQMSGSLCSGCGKAVGSRSLTALGRKWHPEHFVCAFCMNPLAGASFKEAKGKPYCTPCFSKLFGQ